jgi:hypothetical protein
LNVLPHIPGIASFYKPNAFQFVAVEGLFFKEGYEDCLIPLIESALAIHGVHFALTWLDTGSQVYSTFRKFRNFGIFSRFISRIPADVKLKVIGWDEKDKNIFYTRPAYLSCIDMT